MANPRVKDGHIRIANDLWGAWMRVGSLKERVFKAIIWECWGFEDRREAKQPVPITRGKIAQLTGITHKPTISQLTAELVREKLILRRSGGSLSTASYWPNQDYEGWSWGNLTSRQNPPSHDIETRTEEATTPRRENPTTPSPQNPPRTKRENPTPQGTIQYMTNNKHVQTDKQSITTTTVQPSDGVESGSGGEQSTIALLDSLIPLRGRNWLAERLDSWVTDYSEEQVRSAIQAAKDCIPRPDSPINWISTRLKRLAEETTNDRQGGNGSTQRTRGGRQGQGGGSSGTDPARGVRVDMQQYEDFLHGK